MEKYDVYLNQTIHKCDVYVGAKSQSLAIRLRNRILETDVRISKLPFRFDISIANELILDSNKLMVDMVQYVNLARVSMALGSLCGTATLEKAASVGHSAILDSDAGGSLDKTVGIQDNSEMELCHSDVRTMLARYRLLEELDDYTLNDIDDYTLEYLYYVNLFTTAVTAADDTTIVTADGKTLAVDDIV